MDVGGGREAEAAGELRGEIGDDVAEEIVGDDDVELAGVADDLHGEGVYIKVAGVDLRIFGADDLEDALPEVAGEGHRVGLVRHAKTLKFVGAGVVEGVADDALDAFAGVDVFLDGNLVGSVLLIEAADADIETFGIFAEDHEADVVGGNVTQRSEALVEEFGRAGVDEEVELEAEAEEDVRGVLVGGHAGIAEGAEEDGVEFIAQHFDGAGRERDVFAEEFVGAPIEFHELDGAVALGGGGFDALDGDGRDFLADAVAGDDGDARVGSAVAMWDVGHLLAPVRVTGVTLA